MKIVSATGLGGLWALEWARNKLALRNLNLRSHFSIFDSFRDIRVHIYDFLKFVGGLGRVKLFLGQSICIDKTNTFHLKFLFQYQNCRSHSFGWFVGVRVSEISAFIRTDGQTDMTRSTRLVVLILIKNTYTLWGRKR